jgi:hypothetical protein
MTFNNNNTNEDDEDNEYNNNINNNINSNINSSINNYPLQQQQNHKKSKTPSPNETAQLIRDLQQNQTSHITNNNNNRNEYELEQYHQEHQPKSKNKTSVPTIKDKILAEEENESFLSKIHKTKSTSFPSGFASFAPNSSSQINCTEKVNDNS